MNQRTRPMKRSRKKASHYSNRRPGRVAPAYRLWEKKVAGIRRFLSELDGLTGLHGGLWVSNMRAYYERALESLLENKPAMHG